MKYKSKGKYNFGKRYNWPYYFAKYIIIMVPSDSYIGCKRNADYISRFWLGRAFIFEIFDNLLSKQIFILTSLSDEKN